MQLIRPLVRGLTTSPLGIPAPSAQWDFRNGIPPGWTYTGPSIAYDPDTPSNSGSPVRSQKGMFIGQAVQRMNKTPQDLDPGTTDWLAVTSATDGGAAAVSYGPHTNGRIIESGGSSGGVFRISTATWTSGDVLTVTSRYYAGTSGRYRIQLRNDTAATSALVRGPAGALAVDLETAGTISNLTNVDLGNGFHFVSFQVTTNSTPAAASLRMGPDSATVGANVTALMNTVHGSPMWTGDILSSPTLQTVTRDADVLYGTDPSLLPLTANGPFTLLWRGEMYGTEVDHAAANQFGRLWSLNGGAGNLIGAYQDADSGQLLAVWDHAGIAQATAAIGGAVDRRGAGIIKVVVAYDGANGIRAVATGDASVTTATVASGSFAAFDRHDIGQELGSHAGNRFHTSESFWQSDDMTDEQLSALVA